MTQNQWPFPRIRTQFLVGFGVLLLLLCLFPFWGAIATAAIFAFGLKRPIERVQGKIHFRQKPVVILALFAILFTFLLPISFLGLRLYQIAAGNKEKGISGAFSAKTLEQASAAYQNLEGRVASLGAKWKVFEDVGSAREGIQENLAAVGKAAFAAISGGLLSLPDFVVTTIVFGLFLYLFLTRGRQIGENIVGFGIMSSADVKRTSQVLQTSCYSTIISNMLVGAIQATFIVVGARIFGFTESVLIFTIVFFLSFIPFIGAAPVAFFLAALAFFAGHTSQGIGMAVVGLVGGLIDNIIRPYLISDGKNEVHPVLAFAAILGAIAIFGLKGLFFGPVILTATTGLLLSKGEEG